MREWTMRNRQKGFGADASLFYLSNIFYAVSAAETTVGLSFTCPAWSDFAACSERTPAHRKCRQ